MIKMKTDTNVLDVVKIGYKNSAGSFAEFSRVYEVTAGGAKRLLFRKGSTPVDPDPPAPPETDWVTISVDMEGDTQYISGATAETNGTQSTVTITSTEYIIGEVFVCYNGASEGSYSPDGYVANVSTEHEAQGCSLTVSLTDDYKLSITADFYYA